MEIFLDQEDSDLELFEQRNQQIQQLQQQSLYFKEQLLKHISNKDYDCSLITPIPHPLENMISQESLNDKQLTPKKSNDLASNRSKNNQNSSRQNNKPTKSINSLKKSYLISTPKKETAYLSPKCTPASDVSKTKKTSIISASNKSKSSRNEQTNKHYSGTSPTIYKNWLKIEGQRHNYAQQSVALQNKSDINTKIKTEEPRIEKMNPSTQPKLPQRKEKSPAHVSVNNFDCWYNSQKTWYSFYQFRLRQTEEKIFKQRLQLEQNIEKQEQYSFSPHIQEGSKYIVSQKYQNATLLERQKQYKEEAQYKQIQRQIREDEDKKLCKIRISPMSRKILRSTSPKSNCSFTICNSSNQNYSTIIQK